MDNYRLDTTPVKLKLKLVRNTERTSVTIPFLSPLCLVLVWICDVTSVPAGSHSLLSVGCSNAFCTQTEMNGWKYPDLPIKSEFYRRCLLHCVLFLTHCVYLKSRNVLPWWCQFNKQDVTLKRFPRDSEWRQAVSLTCDLTIAAHFSQYFRPSLKYSPQLVSHWWIFAVVSSRLKRLFYFQ